jgi:hypothetical protein
MEKVRTADVLISEWRDAEIEVISREIGLWEAVGTPDMVYDQLRVEDAKERLAEARISRDLIRREAMNYPVSTEEVRSGDTSIRRGTQE